MSVCKVAQGGHSRRNARTPSALALAIAGVAATIAAKATLRGLAFAQPRSPALYSQQKRSAAVALRARGGADDEDDYEFPGLALETSMLQPGQEVDGTVSSFGTNKEGVEFGVFVDIGAERDGLVSMGRLKPTRIEAIKDAGLEIGQKVKAWVVSVGEDRLALSLVRGKTLPRADVALFKGCDPAEWMTGYVARVTDFGAFVALRPPNGELAEAQGLVYRTEIKEGRVESPADELSELQEVKVRVLSVDPESGKMSLSMKEPEMPNEEKYKPFLAVKADQWVDGVVKAFENFGAFVEVTSSDGAKAQGLLHISEIKDSGFVEDPAEELELDQEVKVRILKVDAVEGKMSLSMKTVPAEGEEVEA